MVSYKTNVRFGDADGALVVGAAMLVYETGLSQASQDYELGPLHPDDSEGMYNPTMVQCQRRMIYLGNCRECASV